MRETGKPIQEQDERNPSMELKEEFLSRRGAQQT